MKTLFLDIQHNRPGYSTEVKNEVLKDFKMPIPTKAKVIFCQPTIDKMVKARNIVINEQFNKIEINSSTIKGSEHCFVELYYHDQIIPISLYNDFDRYFDTFDQRFFSMTCDFIYSKFFIKFHYSNGCKSFSFYTKNFDVDELTK